MADCGDPFEELLSEALSLLKKKGLNLKLKSEQKKAIKQLYQKKDLVAVLPTGFGKSLIFQLLVIMGIKEKGEKSGILVITPLTSIIKDQIEDAEAMGLSACNLSEKLSELCDVEDGKYNIVYASAESATDKRFLDSLKKDSVFAGNLLACIVDESHTVETWTGLRKPKVKQSLGASAKVFRGAYGQLSILRSFFKQGTPMAALTGTADVQTCSTITSQLSLNDPLLIHISPNRENLRFSVVNCNKSEIFQETDWLIRHIRENGESTSKTIIFCNTMNDIASVVNYLMLKLGRAAYHPQESCIPSNCLLGIYHSSCWQHNKDRVVRSLKGQGKVRVVVASTALSMGVNFPDIRYIVNWGPARSLLDQHQEAGRAGRDGLLSHVRIIYHGQQLSYCEEDVKDFVKAKDCLRVAAYKTLDSNIKPLEPAHLCCSHCALDCHCNGDDCNSNLPLFEQHWDVNHEAPREAFLSRPVSNQDKLDLMEALEEIKDNIVKSHAVFDGISSHGFSRQLVDDVVKNCHRIFTVSDILELCPVFSVKHSLKILEVLQETFLDIPNFEEFMSVISRMEHSSECQNLERVIRDVTLLDDNSESEDDEELIEVLM